MEYLEIVNYNDIQEMANALKNAYDELQNIDSNVMVVSNYMYISLLYEELQRRGIDVIAKYESEFDYTDNENYCLYILDSGIIIEPFENYINDSSSVNVAFIHRDVNSRYLDYIESNNIFDFSILELDGE